VLKNGDIGKWIAIHGDQVREFAVSMVSDLILPAQQL
jgi:hypothetical protein